jgi:hypothetical protein
VPNKKRTAHLNVLNAWRAWNYYGLDSDHTGWNQLNDTDYKPQWHDFFELWIPRGCNFCTASVPGGVFEKNVVTSFGEVELEKRGGASSTEG